MFVAGFARNKHPTPPLFEKLPLTIFIALIVLAGCSAPMRQAELVTNAQPFSIQQQTPSPPTGVVNLPYIVRSGTDIPLPSSTPTITPTATSETPLHFAVIGDYGLAGQPEQDVANLVKSWQPDLIITTGDNNYPSGSADTIDANIGAYFCRFISFCPKSPNTGPDRNRFFPTLGNHDWMPANARPYLDFFTLPGNERYYDFTWGPVHFFAIDSDSHEPDGVSATSAQAAWLQSSLAASQSPWNLVYFHHAPYSSARHGSTEWMRWPFKEWGAQAVLAGHDHVYERLSVDGMPFFTVGISGGPIYAFYDILPESQFRYNEDYGAMRVEATRQKIIFQFFNRKQELLDSYTLETTR